MAGKKKLLITGGFGYIGSWLTLYFADKYDVYILSRSVPNNNDVFNCSYNIIHADICNYNELANKLSVFDFDYCIHAASFNEYFENDYYKKALDINTLGTRNLLEVLKNTNIKKFIYLSTFHVYGKSCGFISEGSDLNPQNDYAATHLFAEIYIKQLSDKYKIPFVIFRITNGYGVPKNINTNKWYLIVNSLVKSAVVHKRIILQSNGEIMRDFIWIGDICCIIEESFKFEMGDANIFNLSSGVGLTVFELSKVVKHVYEELYRKDIEIIRNKNDKTKYDKLIVDNSKLLKVLLAFNFHNKIEYEVRKIFRLLEIKIWG